MQSTRADKPNRVLVKSSQPQPGLCVIRWQASALPIQPGYQLCNDDASQRRNIHRALAPFPPAFNMGNDQPHPSVVETLNLTSATRQPATLIDPRPYILVRSKAHLARSTCPARPIPI
ncbi:hypothetical protein CCHR01_13078 [Colletotrichum chrysophilum]|uniref:Uncharacterized protein n=1 Tax=Colletotrichum chrysophilum TaxID=1836956 RepID=A0AAD9AAS7_9PEZI|nr:hypothetical protein CCHR01_13078 [Colletotrichum chrysophilum]